MGPLASGRPQCYSKPGINPHFVQSMRAVAQERAAAERSGAYFNERTALDEQLLSVFSEELPSGRTVSARARKHLRGDASKSLRSLRNGHNPFDRAVIKPSCAHCTAGAGASTRGLVKHIFCPERKKFDSAVEAEAVEIFRRSLIDAYSCHLAGKLIATVEQAPLAQITYGRNQRSPRPRCGSRRHTPPSARAPRYPPLALSLYIARPPLISPASPSAAG